MTKEQILAEIRRTAQENGGTALGRRRFQEETGIGDHLWQGKHWRRWNEAVEEAGFSPKQKNEPIEAPVLLGLLAQATEKLGRFPTAADLGMERQNDAAFPWPKVFDRLGKREERIALLRAYSVEKQLREVLAALPKAPDDEPEESTSNSDAEDDAIADGSVYMVRHGRHYKIGKTFDVPRRHRQIALELPEALEPIHVIRTDDVSGIEAYWHRRFESKRTNGEWFALTRDDIRAFKRRKFM